jgi:two-component system nitrate/nitrite response regulator NarL
MSAASDARARASPIRVIVAADVRLYREGLAIALQAGQRVNVIATAATAQEAVVVERSNRPDVALVDTEMPDGIAAIRAIALRQGTAVIALAVPERGPDVIACIEAGAAGYVTREGAVGDLVSVIESVLRGEAICSPRMVAVVLNRLSALAAERTTNSPVDELTVRELQIVELIDVGLSNKEIAAQLSIDVSTVKNHVHHILEKLRVRRRAEAAARMRTSAAWRAILLERAAASVQPQRLSQPG